MAMSKVYRVGVIGCGGIANGKHLPALSRQDKVQVVAFCDIIKERAEAAAEQYGSADAAVYTDYQELLKDASIDIVHVLTPNDAHAEISIAALEAGKHVMCEKPMAKTAADAKRMAEAAKRAGKKLTIGYDNRFRQDSLYLKKSVKLASSAISIMRKHMPSGAERSLPGVYSWMRRSRGRPAYRYWNPCAGSDALDDGQLQTEGCAGDQIPRALPKRRRCQRLGTLGPEKFTVEDSAFGMIVMENGATITLEASWALNSLDVDEAKCSLSGTEAGADMRDGLRINGEKHSKLYTNEIELGAGGVAFYEGKEEKSTDIELRKWIEAIEQDKDPVVTPEQAYVVSRILEAIYESAQTGKAVYLD